MQSWDYSYYEMLGLLRYHLIMSDDDMRQSFSMSDELPAVCSRCGQWCPTCEQDTVVHVLRLLGMS